MHWTTDKRKKSETDVELMKGIYELLSFACHSCQLDAGPKLWKLVSATE